jgi:hypothetical protein
MIKIEPILNKMQEKSKEKMYKPAKTTGKGKPKNSSINPIPAKSLLVVKSHIFLCLKELCV